ncbi:MAG: hypothetical protein IKN11_06390 [Bacteroidales bacterium]|nr:hypothetical protein [Bacteroidales bacterium]
MRLLFDYPWYFILFCLAAGAVYSYALYRRGKGKASGNETLPPWAKRGLAALRFVTVTLLALLLLGPVVRRNVNRHEKPVIVVTQDVSGSIAPTEKNSLEGLRYLEKEYEVVYDSFGGGSTDIAAALSDIGDRFAGRNLGAVVLLSDGIYNQGQDPVEAATALAVPVYTIGLGDTSEHRDAWIAEVRAGRVAYAGSRFPMEVTIRARKMKWEHSVLKVTHGGKELLNKPIHYSDNAFIWTETLLLDAEKPGLQSYTVSVSPCSDEATVSNNSRTVAVEVLDGRRKVAIVAAAPHPDISALKQGIESNPNYEVEVFRTMADLNGSKKVTDACDVLILHNLPCDAETQKAMQALPPQVPRIYILGNVTDLSRFNALHCGMEITAKSRHSDEVTASKNDAFSLFALDDATAGRMESLPPLSAPFGNYRTAAGVQSLFYAKLNGSPTDRPLIAFGRQGETRCSFVVGEGLWRWRLHSYLMTGSHDDFDQLVEKMVVYTGAQGRRDRLNVDAERIYREDERVTLHAEFYDDNWELTNKPDMVCELSATSNGNPAQTTKYDFHPSGQGYSLDLGSLLPGEYRYRAVTSFAGKQYSAMGAFVVEDFDMEQLSLVADHTLLNTIAQSTGGEMLDKGETGKLGEILKQRGDLKNVIYTHPEHTPLVSLPLILVLLVLLLAVEWAGRKYYSES